MLKIIGKRTFREIMDEPTEIFKQRKRPQITTMLSEDGTLKYDFMFPLQKIVMAKIVNNLWMNEINQERKTDNINWEEMKDIIVAKISQLLLPIYISQQLQDIVVYFGESIYNWIEYHHVYLFYFEKSAYSAADFIKNITWTVRGKIDYGQTAKNILANQGRLLSDDHKYKLACMYCLEDEIAVLAPKITANKFYLSDIRIDIYPMVYFWTAHFTGNNTLMNNSLNWGLDDYDGIQYDGHRSINEYIMLLLIIYGSPNDIPIRYMWNELTEEEKAKLVVELVKNVGNQDVRFSLLSNIQYGLQQNVFKECSDCVLCGSLYEWWWWGEYFLPTLHYTFNIMHPKSYWQVLLHLYKENMQKCRYERKHMYDEFKSLFKQLWRESPLEFKDFVFQLENQYRLELFLTDVICYERDTDIFELIFHDLSPQNKKLMFSENLGINICAILIRNDKWNLLELFLKNAISSEEDINQLKERLVNVHGRRIVARFLHTDAYDALKRFIIWAFKSKEEVWKFFEISKILKLNENHTCKLYKFINCSVFTSEE